MDGIAFVNVAAIRKKLRKDDYMPQGLRGQLPNSNGKCKCERCNKILTEINFYQYKDGSKCNLCKACLTAHIDNFDEKTFLWVLETMDVPYVPIEWNVIRDKAFAKDPYKMNGTTVIGKYLAKMRLKQWKDFSYKDSEMLQQQAGEKAEKKEKEKKDYEKELKQRFENGQITEAEYKTLVSTETQAKDLPPVQGDVITGVIKNSKVTSYEQALNQLKNPFQEKNFIPEEELLSEDPSANLSHQDKIYLAMKWGRLYTPAQWVALEQLYTEFMNSFDIQGAARIDTLKKICKTSLKMDQAIDSGDIDSYQKLSRVYDSMMKSAKFTEAQNKESEGSALDSASAIVDYVESHTGKVPRYHCKEPKDVVDKILQDLKDYNRTLIYEDKSLAQEIEKYLQEKRIREERKRDQEEAKKQGKREVELKDEDFAKYKEQLANMKAADDSLTDESIEQEYLSRRVSFEI